MRFDIGIHPLKVVRGFSPQVILIDYHGEHHYKYNPIFSRLEEYQRRDMEKKKADEAVKVIN